MKKILLNFVTATAILLSGCATTTTGPTHVGGDTYIVSRQEGAFPTGNKPLLTEAITEANKFCTKKEKTVKLINSHENPGPYILGNYPKATVTFSCIEEPKPEYYKILNNNTLKASNAIDSEFMSYDDSTKSGVITLNTNLRGRDDALKLIGDICSSKNVSLQSGKTHKTSGATYTVSNESYSSNKLTINYSCIY